MVNYNYGALQALGQNGMAELMQKAQANRQQQDVQAVQMQSQQSAMQTQAQQRESLAADMQQKAAERQQGMIGSISKLPPEKRPQAYAMFKDSIQRVNPATALPDQWDDTLGEASYNASLGPKGLADVESKRQGQESLAEYRNWQMSNKGTIGGAGQYAPPEDQYETPDMGVPAYDGADPYQGMNPAGKTRLRLQFEKQLGESQAAAKKARGENAPAKRFTDLNGENATGGFMGNIPFRGSVDSGFAEMEGIAAEMSRKMREPGEGATSDFDARMFQKATVGVTKPKEANANIAKAFVARNELAGEYAAFQENYLAANGHLRGAEQAWGGYLDANPIFDPASKAEFAINPNRVAWKDYYSKGGKPSQPAAKGGTTVSTQEQYDALPSGTLYTEDDGQQYRKP